MNIPVLKDGEFKHVFGVSIPGFALMQAPQPVDKGKIITGSEPHPPHCEVTFGLTVIQGDWKQFIVAGEGQAFVGLLTGDGDRHALISLNLQPYPDPKAAFENMQRNLALIDYSNSKLLGEDLSMLLWMERNPEDAILMTELHNIGQKET